MTPEEWKLIEELALAVHEMAPPDSQCRISAAMQAVQGAFQRAEYERQQQEDAMFHRER